MFYKPFNTQHKTGMGSSASLMVSFLAAVKEFRGLDFDIHSAS
jgi:mevalonate kinase